MGSLQTGTRVQERRANIPKHMLNTRGLQSRCEEPAEEDAGNSVSHVQSVGLAYDRRNSAHCKCAEFNISRHFCGSCSSTLIAVHRIKNNLGVEVGKLTS